MSGDGSFALAVVAVVTLVAAATDLWTFRVYNVLTIPSIFLGIVVSSILGGFSGLGSSLLGVIVGFCVLAFFFALGGVGAGDVKLFAALGAWLGPWFTMEVFAASAVAAGLYAMGLVLLRGGFAIAVTDLYLLWTRMLDPSQWKRPEVQLDTEVKRPDRRGRLVPFAAMTCLGFFAVMIGHRLELERATTGSGRSASVASLIPDQPGGVR
jgi:prepilin peptidase CpaA